MNRVARMTAPDRAELFSETGNRQELPDAIVEKDFWVCWTLLQAFTIDAFKDVLLFKGGTSLSKIYQAINRFSEDIDLAIDYTHLGFVGERDPRKEGISRTKQLKLLEEMLQECGKYIRTDFVVALRRRFADILGDEAWSLEIDPEDPHIVRFAYPKSSVSAVSYIASEIVLELGTHAEFIPRERFSIRPIAAEEFPKVFDNPEVNVTALLAKRTFWEKVTILHAEFHRDAAKPLPARYSRHYYDVAMLAESAIKAEALADRELLSRVVAHKQIFYPAAWARYDIATPGQLKLSPEQGRIAALKQDYREMGVMIFGNAPTFDWVLERIAVLGQEVNAR